MLAQKDITKFMGIPVDGFKKDMIQKLKAKGFEYDTTTCHRAKTLYDT